MRDDVIQVIHMEIKMNVLSFRSLRGFVTCGVTASFCP